MSGKNGGGERDSYLNALRDAKSRRNVLSQRQLQIASQRNLVGAAASSPAVSRRALAVETVAESNSSLSVDGGGGGRTKESSPEKHVQFSAQADEVAAPPDGEEKSFDEEDQNQLCRETGVSGDVHRGETAFYVPNTSMRPEGDPRETGRRVAIQAASGSNAMAAWRELVMESLHDTLHEDDFDSDDDDDDSEVEAAAHSLPFYAAPLQRQLWLDDQILPHINWGDLFFDLFYVAAAYNMGALIISSMTPDLFARGILYFVGIFGPLYNAWESKLVYESRYSTVDYFHRLVEIVRVIFLSFSILHITPLELMSDPRSIEMFCFSLGLLLECLVRIFLKLELVNLCNRGMKGDVDNQRKKYDFEAIKNHSSRKLITSYVPLAMFYLAAVIISGVKFFHKQDDANKGSGSYGESYKYDGDDGANYGKDGYEEGDGHNRFLGAGVEYASTSDLGNYSHDWTAGDLPMTLCAVGYFLNMAFTALRKTVWLSTKEDIRRYNIPSNIDFCIHRYGEFIMLMLGEAVLSLLIVETTESTSYYIVALLGVVTVIIVQFLHFESEPSHADHHALWRNMSAGMWYSVFLQLLSLGLIAFGTSYKVMLKGIHKSAAKADDGYGGGKRWLLEDDEMSLFGLRRSLGASVAVSDHAAAALFCGSLTVTLLALELLTNTHRGMHENIERLYHHRVEGGLGLRFEIVALTAFKLGLIVFLVTLFTWMEDPVWITFAGFVAVAFIAGTRVLNWKLVHVKKRKKVRPGKVGKPEAPSVPSQVTKGKFEGRPDLTTNYSA